MKRIVRLTSSLFLRLSRRAWAWSRRSARSLGVVGWCRILLGGARGRMARTSPWVVGGNCSVVGVAPALETARLKLGERRLWAQRM